MTGPIDAAGADWPALRRRFAGEALANILAFCGWRAETGERAGEEFEARADGGAGRQWRPSSADRVEDETIGPYGAFRLQTEDGPRHLNVGPVTLLWRGTPLRGEPPDWPRRAAPDAARFFLTARPLSAPAELDFDLAARRDECSPY